MKIKKGDNVRILAGKDRGKSGKVIKVYPQIGKVTVEGVNIYKKHSRPKKQGEKGEIVSVVRPIDVSNAVLVCPKCGKPSRPGFRSESGKKIRYCKKCKSEV
ncbi:50S ribosomal protein L24 [Candidatus Jorgensenbacteria bacterium GWA1_49_17]|uniref:Large ribosomal subunit protein uL24 n=2 Tax=Candidatus Joergenseniibacteriota TaxID=1752739 RepID=A0A1F6BR34_9BACT|nr:MAG: 50S ribosomal protein L24 [Candidatus Jorgensenbacteria bacterium GWC1_48_12]OGG39982.1 MAG: 50S ribosomal protein L24 [Candidatus Jorgensenbacteria bacterium GWA1_49_17]